MSTLAVQHSDMRALLFSAIALSNQTSLSSEFFAFNFTRIFSLLRPAFKKNYCLVFHYQEVLQEFPYGGVTPADLMYAFVVTFTYYQIYNRKSR